MELGGPEAPATRWEDTGSTPALFPFRGPERWDAPDHLPFAFRDYLELVDWAGRAMRDDKRGAIAASAPPILARVGIDPEAYIERMAAQRSPFIRAMGRADRLREAAADLGQRFLKGISEAHALFPVEAG